MATPIRPALTNGFMMTIPQLILKLTGTWTIDSMFEPLRVAGTNDQPRTALTAAESKERSPDDWCTRAEVTLPLGLTLARTIVVPCVPASIARRGYSGGRGGRR